MHTLGCIIISVFITSLVSLVGAVTFIFKGKSMDKVFFVLVSFAAGSFLGAAFFDLLPEAVKGSSGASAFSSVLAGIIFFFLMEKFLYWYHCHEEDCRVHQFTYLNLVGDGIHNFLDGIIISSAFLTSLPIGVAATAAIIAHELPQELGDFGMLVYGGFSRKKALLCNFIISLTALAGALLGYFFLNQIKGFTPIIIGVGAGGFIYMACSDLIPEMHKERKIIRSLGQFALMMLGIGIIFIVKFLFEK